MKNNYFKKEVAILLILTVSITAGCIDNKPSSTNDNSEVALEDICLTLDDLPSGYRILSIGRNLSTQFGFTDISEVKDVLGITFIHEEYINLSGVPMINIAIARYSDNIDAVIAYTNSTETIDASIKSLFNVFGMPIDTSYGDSSIGMYYNGELNENYLNSTSAWAYLHVRVNKTLFFVSLSEIQPGDFPYVEKTKSYMEIMLEKYNMETNKM